MKNNKIDSHLSEYEKMMGEDLSNIVAVKGDVFEDDPEMAKLERMIKYMKFK